VSFANSAAEGAQVFVSLLPPDSAVPFENLPVPADALAQGFWAYRFEGVDFGTYRVAVAYTVQGPPTLLYGPGTITVSQSNPTVTGFDFSVEFPEAPVAVCSISGTVTLLGDFPTGEDVYVGACPDIDQPATGFVEVTADDVVDGEIAYTIADLPVGSYLVSIFTYEMATHTAQFFGSYSGTAEVTVEHPDVTGIDFDADPSLLE